jgi:hypothetical protein
MDLTSAPLLAVRQIKKPKQTSSAFEAFFGTFLKKKSPPPPVQQKISQTKAMPAKKKSSFSNLFGIALLVVVFIAVLNLMKQEGIISLEEPSDTQSVIEVESTSDSIQEKTMREPIRSVSAQPPRITEELPPQVSQATPSTNSPQQEDDLRREKQKLLSAIIGKDLGFLLNKDKEMVFSYNGMPLSAGNFLGKYSISPVELKAGDSLDEVRYKCQIMLGNRELKEVDKSFTELFNIKYYVDGVELIYNMKNLPPLFFVLGDLIADQISLKDVSLGASETTYTFVVKGKAILVTVPNSKVL